MKVLAMAALVCSAQFAVAAEPSTVSNELIVGGEVRHERHLSVDQLRQIARRRGVVEQAGYSGVRLVDLLAEAEISDDAPLALRRTYVVAVATDGYPAVFSWGELYNTPVGGGVIVATDRDGLPLRDGEGRFALVSLADTRSGPRHVKWLARIDVRRIPEGATRQR
jgi:DMSO/TMAO reductase YedYZ molybdopterin-dependent catalytic subunit